MNRKPLAALAVGIAVITTAVVFYIVGHGNGADDNPSAGVDPVESVKQQIAQLRGESAETDVLPTDASLEEAEALWQEYLDKHAEKLLGAYIATGSIDPDLEKFMPKIVARDWNDLKSSGVMPPNLPTLDNLHYTIDSEGFLRVGYIGPQTVEAIMAAMEPWYLMPIRGEDRVAVVTPDAIAERAKWLGRAIERGAVVEDYMDYLGFVKSLPMSLKFEGDEWDKRRAEHLASNPDTTHWLTAREKYRLPETASIREIEDAIIDDHIRKELGAKEFARAAMKTDKPFISAYIDTEDWAMVTGGQAKLTYEQKYLLSHHGIAPPDIKVIYVDKDGKPLPDGEAPRFDHADIVSKMSVEEQLWEASRLANLSPFATENWSSVDWMRYTDYAVAVYDALDAAASSSAPSPPAKGSSAAAPPPPTRNRSEAAHSGGSAKPDAPTPADVKPPPGPNYEQAAAYLELLDKYLDESKALSPEARKILRGQSEVYRQWLQEQQLRKGDAPGLRRGDTAPMEPVSPPPASSAPANE